MAARAGQEAEPTFNFPVRLVPGPHARWPAAMTGPFALAPDRALAQRGMRRLHLRSDLNVITHRTTIAARRAR